MTASTMYYYGLCGFQGWSTIFGQATSTEPTLGGDPSFWFSCYDQVATHRATVGYLFLSSIDDRPLIIHYET
jgi:hypothetical protein